MTWELRRPVTMGMIPIALVVVASFVGGAAQALAFELGELQAVPSNSLPYVFRLPLLSPPHSAPVSAAVTVRQPPDTLAFVRQHVIELRLRTLADVELELSYGGQTLNRLLLKSELQAARMRVEMVPASNLSLAVKAKSRDRPSPEVIPVAQAVADASNRSLIEREIEGIRQEIHGLVERVVPWGGGSPSPEDRGGAAIPTVLTLVLGGVFIVAVTSLSIGYLMQWRVMERERRRRAVLIASIRRMCAQLAGEVPILPALQSPPRSRPTNEALVPVALRRRVYVAQTTRRRLRVWTSGRTRNHTQEHDTELIRLQARASRCMPSAAAELLAALAQLRGELMRLQGSPTTPTTAEHGETLLRQTSR